MHKFGSFIRVFWSEHPRNKIVCWFPTQKSGHGPKTCSGSLPFHYGEIIENQFLHIHPFIKLKQPLFRRKESPVVTLCYYGGYSYQELLFTNPTDLSKSDCILSCLLKLDHQGISHSDLSTTIFSCEPRYNTQARLQPWVTKMPWLSLAEEHFTRFDKQKVVRI